MSGNPVLEQAWQDYYKAQRESTAQVILAYGNKLIEDERVRLDSEFKRAFDRLDKLDVISDTDGVKTAVEAIQELQKLLSEDGSLKDVLGSLKNINDQITEIKERLVIVETTANRADTTSKTNAENISLLQQGLAAARADLAKSIEQSLTDAKAYTDSERDKLRLEIKAAVDEGGEALVLLKQRVKLLEDDINDTEVDGVTKKGLKSRVSDSEKAIINNANTAKEQAQTAESNSKKYVDGNFVGLDMVNDLKDQIPADENAMRAICGLEPVSVEPTT